MIRGFAGTILWACLAGAVGVGLFFVKHEVKDQETRLADINREIQRNQEEMHVLRAEWSYLNDPARLRELAEKHLAMHPINANQVVASLDALPVAGGQPAFAGLPADRIQPQPGTQPPAKPQSEIAKTEVSHPIPSAKAAPAPAPAPRPQPGKPSGGHQVAHAAPFRHLAAVAGPALAADDVVGTSREAR